MRPKANRELNGTLPHGRDLRAVLRTVDGVELGERTLHGFTARSAPQVILLGAMTFVREDGGTEPNAHTRTYIEAFAYRMDAGERL